MKKVEVVWYDIYEVDGWRTLKSFNEQVEKEPRGVVCRTIGYIVQQSDELISVAQTLQEREPDEAEFSNFINIPTGIIREVREL